MADGIGAESSIKASLGDDIDLYRYKYLDYEDQIDGNRIYVSFVSPIFSVYEKYRFYLLAHSKIEELPRNWWYRPDYVSHKHYGTTAWWQLILWINDVKSIEYFNIPNVIIPDPVGIGLLMNEAYKGKDGYIDINEDAKHNRVLWTPYISAFNTLNGLKTDATGGGSGSDTADKLTEEDKETVFCRELFTMDIPTLRMKYVDLKDVPVTNSIRVIADCRPNLIYDKHYSLIEDKDGVKKRVTWDPDVINNAGLLFKLHENDILEVEYVKYI